MDIYQLSKQTETANQELTYTYLTEGESDNGSILSLDLDLCLGREATVVNTQICLYRKNTHSLMVDSREKRKMNMEYLSFYLEYASEQKTFGFPSFQYDCVSAVNDMSTPDHFKSECIQFILNLFPFEQKPSHDKSVSDMDFGYKGFIVNENTVYAFFEMDRIEEFFERNDSAKPDTPGIWAIVDEIIHQREAFSVDSGVVSFFQKNPIVWNIRYNGANIDYPRAMYAVIPAIDDPTKVFNKTDGSLRVNNEPYDAECKTAGCVRTIHKMPYVYSDVFGERYLFTPKPIHGSATIDNSDGVLAYNRYACFVYNPKYIFSKENSAHDELIKKYPQNSIEKIRELDDDTLVKQPCVPCVCFPQKVNDENVIDMCGFIYSDMFIEIDA
jgi:hypothetical protein